MEDNLDDILKQATEKRGQAVIQRRVDLVKAIGEFNKLGGADKYEASLSAIVVAYGKQGVKASLVREVLHDAPALDKAVTALVEAGAIEKGPGKRDYLLTTKKSTATQPQAPVQPATERVESVDTNPTNNPAWEPVPPTAAAETKTASAKPSVEK